MKDSCSLLPNEVPTWGPAEAGEARVADADTDAVGVAAAAAAAASCCCRAAARPKLTCDNIAVADNLPL